MPPKSNIELGSGQIYFKGLDESFEVSEGQATDEVEWADDQEYIRKINHEPVTFTCEDVQYPKDWVLAECKYCGSKFPIVELYAMLYGTKGWTCPLCVRLGIGRRRSK